MRTLSLSVFGLSACLTAQTQWQVVSPSSPVPGENLAWIDGFGNIVLHNLTASETWRLPYQTAIWTRLSSAAATPGYRSNPAVASDFLRGRAVLFGGRDATGAMLADTWEFDGTNWRQLALAVSPSARHHAGASLDGAGFGVVLAGGQNGTTPLADTWRFDGIQWQTVGGSSGPSGPVAMTTQSQGIVIAVAANGTFEWINGAWQHRATSNLPPPRAGASIAYDAFRMRSVLYGGGSATSSLNDVWEFDGTDWRERTPLGVLVAPRSAHGLVYDPWSQTVRAFGGINRQLNGSGGITTVVLGEHLLYTATVAAAVQQFGVGCTALPVALTCPIPPWVDTTVPVSVNIASGQVALIALGFSNQSFGGVSLPMPLANLGLPGCSLFVAPDVVQVAVSRTNRAVVRLTIPAQPALAGSQVHAQALIQDASASGGFAMTAALTLRIGSS